MVIDRCREPTDGAIGELHPEIERLGVAIPGGAIAEFERCLVEVMREGCSIKWMLQPVTDDQVLCQVARSTRSQLRQASFSIATSS